MHFGRGRFIIKILHKRKRPKKKTIQKERKKEKEQVESYGKRVVEERDEKNARFCIVQTTQLISGTVAESPII